MPPAVLALLTVLSLTVAAWHPAQAAAQDATPTLLASEVRDTPLAAHGSTIAWSSFDRRTRRYRLTAEFRGRVRRLPIPGRAVPFDADLGPGPGGALTAVYSRCRERTPLGDLRLDESKLRGCRLWRYSFATRKERRVPGATSARSQLRPTIWGSRVAFVRLQRAGRIPQLVVRHLRTGRGRVVAVERTRLLANAATIDVARMDLRRSRLVASFLYGETACRRADGDGDKTAPRGSEVLVGSIRTLRSLVAGCELDDPIAATDGVWSGGSVLAAVARRAADGAFDRRLEARTPQGRLLREGPIPELAFTFARAGTTTAFVVYRRGFADGEEEYDVVRVEE